ncbi:hypothetical protein [Streptomyces sp. NPDC006552]|uniref:hypothetical protein n=1 Tax=Streptomyces sp. NPDC006552 TaxID=3157179 RepID=UPI0033AD8C2B
MSTALPSPRDSGAVERGDVAEVVALGNALTELFNGLGVSQNAYAVRIHRDKSTVSRFLRGKKVAPLDFVDRLVREVEQRRGTRLKPEVRKRIDQLRLAAVKETDPAAYELETLRTEMERSQREVDRLARQQEALHVLLERREEEIRAVQGELTQIQEDWRDEVALRVRREEDAVGSEHERTGLAEEVARLRADLVEATALRADAERRCEDLERRVREMEEELAARESDVPGALPLTALKERLVVLWEAGGAQEAGRELTEAAQGRSVEDLIDLVTWLDGRGDVIRRNRLAEEVAHTRTVEVVAAFGTGLMSVKARRDPRRRRGTPSALRCVVDGACAVMPPRDLVTLHRHWEPPKRPQGLFYRMRDEVPENLLTGVRSADVAAEVFDLLDPDDGALVRVMRRARPASLSGGMLIAVVPHLIKRGNTGLAHACCRTLVDHSRELLGKGRSVPPWGDLALAETDVSQVREFVLTAADVLSAQDLSFLLIALFEPRSDYSRQQEEAAARFFQLCVAELHAANRLTDVLTALDDKVFRLVLHGSTLPKVRKVLLAYKL